MKWHFTLILILTGFLAIAQKKFNVELISEDRLRTAIISAPSAAPPPNGYPVVFMLHGTSGDEETYYNAHGWRELGEQEGFIVIFPSSLRWCFYNRWDVRGNNSRFVCGGLLAEACEDVQQDFVDDILFFKKLVKLVSDTVKVDTTRIFCSGFSNGSGMSHKCMVEASDFFAAAAGSSGPLHELDSIVPAKKIPFWYVFGTKDDRYFSENYPDELPFGGDTILAYHYEAIHRALVCQGLTEKFEKVETPINHTYIFSECASGSDCAPYVVTLNKDQTHQFPNGNNYPFDAPRLFWQFFNNPPMTSIGTASHALPSEKRLEVSPVPATDQVIISSKSGKGASLLVFDVMGKLVYKTNMLGDYQNLDKEDVGKGIFFVRLLQAGKLSQTAKIVFE